MATKRKFYMNRPKATGKNFTRQNLERRISPTLSQNYRSVKLTQIKIKKRVVYLASVFFSLLVVYRLHLLQAWRD